MSAADDSVKLDIGGKVFRTTKTTLTNYDGLLYNMMQTYTPGQKDRIFIDRSPKHFDLILNYMRDRWVPLPDSDTELMEIRKEANYYRLPDLHKECNEKLQPKEPKNGLPENKRILETYDEVLRAITRIEKPLIIIYYSVSNDGTLNIPKESPVDDHPRDFWQFWGKYGYQFAIYYKKSETLKTGDDDKDSQWKFTIYRDTKTVYTSTPQDCCDFWKSINEVAERYLNSGMRYGFSRDDNE